VYLGAVSSITMSKLSPSLCRDTAYMEMRLGRMASISFTGRMSGNQIAFSWEEHVREGGSDNSAVDRMFGNAAPCRFTVKGASAGALATIANEVRGMEVAAAVSLRSQDVKAEGVLFLPSKTSRVRTVVVTIDCGVGHAVYDSPEWRKLAEAVNGALLRVRFSNIGPPLHAPPMDAFGDKPVVNRQIGPRGCAGRLSEVGLPAAGSRDELLRGGVRSVERVRRPAGWLAHSHSDAPMRRSWCFKPSPRTWSPAAAPGHNHTRNLVVDSRHQSALVSADDTMAKSTVPDILPGTLDLLILRALQTEALHGWAISERIQQISQDVLQITQGSLYPALHRLEHQGWVEAEWAVSELGRRAKYYRLTASGRRQLAVEAGEWDRMSAAIGRVMKLA
jgi:PadR family transcriptional regulator PadR